MEEVEFKKPEVAFPYVPFVPDCVKVIEQPQKPPILPIIPDSSAEYVVNNLTVKASLRLVSRDGEVETPLAMCPYVKPSSESIFDVDECRKCDLENVSRERHNKFVVGVLNEFVKYNDLGVSAGRLTAPQAPPENSAARLEHIKGLTADKYETAKKAIAYLAPFGLYCGRDFEFDGALAAANEKSFSEGIKLRIKKGNGRVRVNIEGRRPCWWDGVGPRDENGNLVKWDVGEGHTFLTPALRIVAVPEAPPQFQATIAEPTKNPFDALQLPTATSQLLTITDK